MGAVLGVALELRYGRIVELLVAAGVKLFALKPKQRDSFRDPFAAAGAKHNRRDAYMLGRGLRRCRATAVEKYKAKTYPLYR